MTEETTHTGRKFLEAQCGFRVYCKDGMKLDLHGRFDGWSDCYDERIPIFNPRLCPHLEHFGQLDADNFVIEEDDGAIDD